MRIAIEGQRLFRKKKHGMDFVALELIRNLMETDNTNEYFVFVAPGPDKCLNETANFKIIEIPGVFYPVWEQLLLPLYVRVYKCNLLHCTSNTAPVFPGVPLVITLHDIIYLESAWLLKKGITAYQRFGNFYRKLIVPLVFWRSNKIITVSEFERSRILNHFNLSDSEERVIVIHNGVGKQFIRVWDHYELSAMQNKYGLPSRYFLHLGNRDPKKNTSGVLRSYYEYLNKSEEKLPLVITDLSDDEIARMVERDIYTMIKEKVSTPGYVPNSDLPAIYSSCEAFLYPSLRESFGIPILEAMGCRVPVITSNLSSMPEIAGNAALLVDPLDQGSIATAILQVSGNTILKAEMVKKGAERAEQFSWYRMATEVGNVYTKVGTRTIFRRFWNEENEKKGMAIINESETLHGYE